MIKTLTECEVKRTIPISALKQEKGSYTPPPPPLNHRDRGLGKRRKHVGSRTVSKSRLHKDPLVTIYYIISPDGAIFYSLRYFTKKE